MKKHALFFLIACLTSFNVSAQTSQDYFTGTLSLLRSGSAVDLTMTKTVGTLTQGQSYRLTWWNGSFNLQRLSDGFSASYSNANLTRATVSLWGAMATLIPSQNNPSLVSNGAVIAKITNWPDDWFGSHGATWYNRETAARANVGNFNSGANDCSNPLFCLHYTYFHGTLQSWVDQYGAGISGSTLTSLLNALYANVKPQLQAVYPGLSDTLYQGLMLQNLANGFYIYGDGPSSGHENLTTMLSSGLGDCGSFETLVRLLGAAWGLQIDDIVLDIDYLPSVGFGAEYYGADAPPGPGRSNIHAINIIKDSTGHQITLDANTNISMDFGYGNPSSAILGASPKAIDRFAGIKKYGFWSYYLEPSVRGFAALNDLPDAADVNFHYPFFLESFRAPVCGTPPCVPDPLDVNTWWLVTSSHNVATPLP